MKPKKQNLKKSTKKSNLFKGEEKMERDVIHGVKNRNTGEIVYTSKPGTYYETHQRAEKWCKKNLGESGEIVQLDIR